LQVVIGPQAEIVAGEIREAMASGEYAALGQAVESPAVSGKDASISARPAQSSTEDTAVAQRLVHALGGSSNVQTAEHLAVTRLRFVVRDTGRADEEALKGAGAAGVMKASENVWHVIAGQRAAAIASALDLILDTPCKRPDQFHLKK
jgi:PTS system N-acetylglucosamine-specific IIC component